MTIQAIASGLWEQYLGEPADHPLRLHLVLGGQQIINAHNPHLPAFPIVCHVPLWFDSLAQAPLLQATDLGYWDSQIETFQPSAQRRFTYIGTSAEALHVHSRDRRSTAPPLREAYTERLAAVISRLHSVTFGLGQIDTATRIRNLIEAVELFETALTSHVASVAGSN